MPERGLGIAEDLALPLDAAVQTFAILAKRGPARATPRWCWSRSC
jgi:hypothetical protein